jgi:hypothetical protein
MKLNIISWNIRHLRMDKVQIYLKLILRQLDAGHVMFFYENKIDNVLDREFIDAIGDPLKGSPGAGSMRLSWRGKRIPVGTNENVWIVYSDQCTTGPKSKHGQGQNFTISLTEQDQYKRELEAWGVEALKATQNLTVLSNLSMGQAKFRIPAIVHILVTKPDGATKTIRVASWHAPGPAQGSPPFLNYYFQTFLNGKVDLFIGDFNMTGLEASPSKIGLPFTLHRTNQSTTISEQGPVNHAEGLDLVYIDGARIAPGITVSGRQIGSAVVSVIPKPDDVSFEDAFELSDHLPVLITLRKL